jgi:hypothetical protein
MPRKRNPVGIAAGKLILSIQKECGEAIVAAMSSYENCSDEESYWKGRRIYCPAASK